LVSFLNHEKVEMLALLIDGPFEHQHHDVEDQPPERVTVEAMPTGEDLLEPIQPGEEFPLATFERHDYRLRGIDRTLSPMGAANEYRLPIYEHIRGT
jgi:hypothetical protein